MGVASIVLDDGGSEDEAIAALLHDAAEDHGGRARLEDIRVAVRRRRRADRRGLHRLVGHAEAAVAGAQAGLHGSCTAAAAVEPARVGRRQGAQHLRDPARSAEHRRGGVGALQASADDVMRVLPGHWCARTMKPAAAGSSTNSSGSSAASNARWDTSSCHARDRLLSRCDPVKSHRRTREAGASPIGRRDE